MQKSSKTYCTPKDLDADRGELTPGDAGADPVRRQQRVQLGDRLAVTPGTRLLPIATAAAHHHGDDEIRW